MSTYNDNTSEQWEKQMQALLEELENRAPYSYDTESDPLYQQYRDQYTSLGRLAMEDTVGQAAALTGGYGSTYGETAGAKAYSSYLDRLNDILPELYDRGQAAYDRQTDELYQRLDFLSGQQQQAQKAEQQSQQAAQEASDRAFDRCMELLEKGIRPSDDMLAAAGLSPVMADAAIAAMQSDGGVVYSGGSAQNSGNTGGAKPASGGYRQGNRQPTEENIKELQDWLGLPVTGTYDETTQAAMCRRYGVSEMSAAEAWYAFCTAQKPALGSQP